MNEQFECACDVPIICQFAVTQTFMSLCVFLFYIFSGPSCPFTFYCCGLPIIDILPAHSLLYLFAFFLFFPLPTFFSFRM